MGGVVNTVKSAISNPIGAIGKGLGTVFTGGLNQLPGKAGAPFRKAGDVVGGALTGNVDPVNRLLGRGGAPDLVGVNGGQDPAEMLAQTGGAPVLANIALGVDPEDALAGYFGKNKQDGSWDEFLGTLNQKDLDAVNSVHGQLTTIQKDRNLRQQAVDKVIGDFPNLTKQAAQARQQAGGEFDDVTKGYMEQALNGTAAKFAANGGISSGAANEAFARVGAEQGMKKLEYMGNREDVSYGRGLNEMSTRLAEVNALRDFQNTMMGGQIQQGFSAQQANLQRQFQGQAQNAEMANQRSMQDTQSKNALFGALGSLGGTVIGASMFGPAGAGAGGAMGSSLFGSASNPAPKFHTSSYDSYSGRA